MAWPLRSLRLPLLLALSLCAADAQPFIFYRGIVNAASFAPPGLPNGSIASGSSLRSSDAISAPCGTNDSSVSTTENLPDIRGSRSKLPRRIHGVWKGIVRTYQGQFPLTLWLRRSSESEGQLDDQPRSTLTKVKFQDGYLSAWMDGDIRTEDANRQPYVLVLSLKRRGRLLNGSVTALSRRVPSCRTL